MATLDPDDSRPSYRQVADRLRAAIESEKLAAGDQLPTHKALADEYGVAVETAKRALGELRVDGLIVTRQGKGSYVRRGQGDEIGSQPEAADIAARVAELSREMAIVKQRLAALETDSID
jgi:DNA-binding GntR family transcriptional regulator